MSSSVDLATRKDFESSQRLAHTGGIVNKISLPDPSISVGAIGIIFEC